MCVLRSIQNNKILIIFRSGNFNLQNDVEIWVLVNVKDICSLLLPIIGRMYSMFDLLPNQFMSYHMKVMNCVHMI